MEFAVLEAKRKPKGKSLGTHQERLERAVFLEMKQIREFGSMYILN